MGILNLNVAVSRNSSGAMIRIFLLPSHQGLKKKLEFLVPYWTFVWLSKEMVLRFETLKKQQMQATIQLLGFFFYFFGPKIQNRPCPPPLFLRSPAIADRPIYIFHLTCLLSSLFKINYNYY